MSTCRHCKKLLRFDHVWEILEESKWFDALAEFHSSGNLTRKSLQRWGENKAGKLAPNLALVRNPTATLDRLAGADQAEAPLSLDLRDLIQNLATEQPEKETLQTPCPYCGGELTEPRPFNLMFKTTTGAVEDPSAVTYLRPETAQGIFTQFWNVVDTNRVKIPFGIAQIGKAFRNEVTPRNFTFRSREVRADGAGVFHSSRTGA